MAGRRIFPGLDAAGTGKIHSVIIHFHASGAEPLSFIYDGGHPPPPATYPPTSGEQPLTAGIHGLATRQTYGRRHRCRRGGLLPRLFTLTPASRGGLFLLRFL